MDDKERDERLEAYLRMISADGTGSAQPMPKTLKSAKSLSSLLGKISILELETLVCLRDRPAAYVRGNTYDALPDLWTSLNAKKHRDRLGPLLQSVGRVERVHKGSPHGAPREVIGTAFVVGRRLVMTNRHVAEHLIDGSGGKLVLRLPGGGVDWRAEAPSGAGSAPSPEYMAVTGVRMIHPYWDMALLEVADVGTRRVLMLAGSPIAATHKRVVVVVGYPVFERDPTVSPELIERVFSEHRGVKRLAPGHIIGMRDATSNDRVVQALAHDVSTLAGTSGAPVFDLETGVVVGVHFGGTFMRANYAVPTWELARDPSVVAQQLNFDSKPTQGAPEWLNSSSPTSANSNAEQPDASTLLGEYLGTQTGTHPVVPEGATLDATEVAPDGDTQEVS